MSQTYVSLDLETTGLNPETDEIIEIGAVRFQGEEVIDTFQTLVNPNRPLPYRIQLLCGIKQADVTNAPPFSDIADSLIAFLGTDILIGHNVAFDTGFLAQKGIKLTNAAYDTYELATILLFQQTDYSLASVTKNLGLATPQHRALPDATATKELFVALLNRAYQLDIGTIEELVRLSQKSNWNLEPLFREILKVKTKTAFSDKRARSAKKVQDAHALKEAGDKKPLVPKAERIPLDIEKLVGILESDGALSKA
ncbi:MAG: hypothetical protein FJ004_08480, partial [Chloroflexi bacterium]|nr:hypothetical protein [Chloroflexota bacterium]